MGFGCLGIPEPHRGSRGSTRNQEENLPPRWSRCSASCGPGVKDFGFLLGKKLSRTDFGGFRCVAIV